MRPHSLVLLVTLGFAAACSLPYAVAAARTPPGMSFTGLLVNPYDQSYYLAAQRSAAEDLPRTNRFTTEVDAPGPVAPLYPLLGEVGGATGLSPLALYHAARVASTLALPALLMVLMGLCFPGDRRRALRGTVLALFSVGLASLVPAFSGRLPAPDNLPEATIFYSFSAFPHFALAYVGVTMFLIALLLAWRERRPRSIVAWGTGSGVLLALSHTFLLLPVALTLFLAAGLAGFRWLRGTPAPSKVAKLALVGASVLAPALPFLLSLRHEMQRFEALQGTGFPATRLAGWGAFFGAHVLLLPLVLAGLWRLRRARSQPGTAGDPRTDKGALGLLLGWLVVEAVLMMTPLTPFQRRFSEGAVIPLAALAAFGLIALGRRETLVVGTVATLGCLLGVAGAGDYGEYVPGAYREAFQHIGADDIVLTGDTIGAIVPAYSSGTVLIGRAVETLRYGEKHSLRDAFAADPGSRETLARLTRHGVNLVMVDEADESFRPAHSLALPCFRPEFTVGSVSAFRIDQQCTIG